MCLNKQRYKRLNLSGTLYSSISMFIVRSAPPICLFAFLTISGQGTSVFLFSALFHFLTANTNLMPKQELARQTTLLSTHFTTMKGDDQSIWESQLPRPRFWKLLTSPKRQLLNTQTIDFESSKIYNQFEGARKLSKYNLVFIFCDAVLHNIMIIFPPIPNVFF